MTDEKSADLNDKEENHAHDNAHAHSNGDEHGHGYAHVHGLAGHHHGHGSAPNDSRGTEGNKKGLLIALAITTGILVLEFFGGLLTNSLALLSDSGHMLSDATSLILSLVAVWFATKPPSPNKTYGFYRFEVLAALLNGLTLFLIALFIMWEAYQRFLNPPTVASGPMIFIAAIGLVANLSSAWALLKKGDVKNNINLRAAYLHVLGDALGSIGALVAGLLMYIFSWYIADPIISVLVALLILKGAWGVITQTIHILMEGTPVAIGQDAVKQTLTEIEGVINVHDLHIWTITSGLDSLSCHLLIEDDKDSQAILQAAIHKVEEEFKIMHCTIQVEKSKLQHAESGF